MKFGIIPIEESEKIERINEEIEDMEYKGEISDGSHTFDELYYHRMVLFAVICNTNKDRAWKSLVHNDGTMFEDYFICGIKTNEGQFTYHYHKNFWDWFKVKVIEKAPAWDGHTADDIIRLLSLV